jgi:hypothetical protein
MAQIMTVANGNNASEVAASRMFAAVLKLRMWEYEQASAAQMFSDRDQFAKLAAFSQGLRGQARAQLGRATEGIGPDSPANSRSARNRRTRGQPLYARSS